MTIAVAVRASDGFVLASDSMAADLSVATSEQKVRACEQLQLAWGFAGSLFLAQRVERALLQLAKTPPNDWQSLDPQGALQHLSGVVRGAVSEALTELRDDVDSTRIAAEFLIVGQTSVGPYAVVVHEDLSATLEEHVFVSIGSKTFAGALRQALSHYLEQPVAVRHALPLAFRAVDAVCHVSAYGVAAPVQLAVVDTSGARLLPPDEVGAVEEQTQAWLATERSLLTEEDGAVTPGLPRLHQVEGEQTG